MGEENKFLIIFIIVLLCQRIHKDKLLSPQIICQLPVLMMLLLLAVP